MAKNTSCGVQLRIRGKVQGVGFRPFGWLLARKRSWTPQHVFVAIELLPPS